MIRTNWNECSTLIPKQYNNLQYCGLFSFANVALIENTMEHTPVPGPPCAHGHQNALYVW